MTNPMDQVLYTVQEVCDHYGVNRTTVMSWVQNGELKPFTVGRFGDKEKRRWRFSAQALSDFEKLRTVTGE